MAGRVALRNRMLTTGRASWYNIGITIKKGDGSRR